MATELEIGEAVVKGYPPAILYLRNDDIVTTELCAFNYFSTFFKGEPEAEAHVWLFDGNGDAAGYFQKDLSLDGQMQLNTSELCPNISGSVAVTLLPKSGAKIRPGKKITTGYYAQYYSGNGAITLSHEREEVTSAPFSTPPWIQTYLTRLLDQSGTVLVNACLASNGEATGKARIVALDGSILAERDLPKISPMGARRLKTMELFPRAKQLVGPAESFALELSGVNMASPFSFYEFPNGKFSLHHF
ncbi:MAG: hypothetical protein KGL35_17945 [Bradyrhizobium sp.]|uniref:hypothetical protein n=1 Tax=Bradyrhizobium sp. TaxID=376 RepID=UPI001C29A887|nr:hypothetical protein [Bradyrhizobium sp.]MBU6463651.1 hypothetical protein [Pseudomonadota bacterium]MDE2066378.1 hypothetical protein [Bradyrhizobium sp.]MDE2470570.1 hypothetical protein [Bradyrhizobium sp.]